MNNQIILELHRFTRESDFLKDLLEVNAMRLKNHIVQLGKDLLEVERAISKTNRVKNSNRWIIFYDPEQKLLKLDTDRRDIKHQLKSSIDDLEVLRKFFTQIEEHVLASTEYIFDESYYDKVFADPANNIVVWHGYRSYHYQRV